MGTLVITGARILTLRGPAGPRRGAAMRDLGVIEDGHVWIENGRIRAVGPGPAQGLAEESEEGELIDAGGAVVMPAFVDCHTHACWAGNRLDEFELALQGSTYLDILATGGGIMSTVRAVRKASVEELTANLLRRLASMIALGTGTVEVKSGYGLTTDDELKMLRAIHAASMTMPQTVVGTFLGAHAIDGAQPGFVDRVIQETLPAVVQEFPEIVCDAFCETNAWSPDDCVRLFEAAQELDCPIRVHADQFNSLGMTRLAIEMGAVSVDHLEATTPADLTMLAESSTFGVALPCSGFHLDDRYAPARQFVDAGGALAIATNCNPGSAPTPSMPFTIALACRKLHLKPAEAITCATFNPACVLSVQSRVGSIEVGKRADLQLLDCADERELAYEFASAGPLVVILGGDIVHARSVERVDAVDETNDEGEDGE